MFGRTNAHPSRPRPLRETGPPPRDTQSFWSSPLRPPPQPPLPSSSLLQQTGDEVSANSSSPLPPKRIIRNATVMTLHSDSESDNDYNDYNDYNDNDLVSESVASKDNLGSDNDSDSGQHNNDNNNGLNADRQRALDLHENDDHFPWYAAPSQQSSGGGGGHSSVEPVDDNSDNSEGSTDVRGSSDRGSNKTTSTTTTTTPPRRSYFTNLFDSTLDHSGEAMSDEDVTPTRGDYYHQSPAAAAAADVGQQRVRGQSANVQQRQHHDDLQHKQQQQQQYDQPIFGDLLLTPMGFDEDDEFLRNPVAQGSARGSSRGAAQPFQTFAGVNEFDESDQIGFQDSSYQVVAKNRRRDQERILENKRRQGRLLLVSLLDNFCLLYDQSPERNRKLFYVICKTLSNMGIIDEEYLEEMSAVRSSYQRAFRQLVLSALTSIKQEQLILESRRIMAPPSTPTSDGNRQTDISRISARLTEPMKTGSTSTTSSAPFLHSPSIATSLLHGSSGFFDYGSDYATSTAVPPPMMRSLSFGDMFDNDPTRYKHDFVEIKRLGRGGFASVYKARNKLDGIEYAIKKVRLRGGAKMRYEKIFREIKFLARLDHKNVVRYYSSWLEHADYPVSSSSSGRNDGDDEYGDEYGDEYDEYEDGTYATATGDSLGDVGSRRPVRRPMIGDGRWKGRTSSSIRFGEETVESSHDIEEELSMGIVFGNDQSLDFSSRSVEHDMTLSISFEEEGEGEAGFDMEKTASNSTVTGRDIPRRLSPSAASTSNKHPHHHRHKSPTVSLEMEGRVPSWGRSDNEDATEQQETENDDDDVDGDDDDRYSASIGKLASSSRTSSSIEEIQRSLPSSLNDSSLGSRLGRIHSHHHHHQDLDSIDEIDTRAMASYPPRRDVGDLPDDPLKVFDHRWIANRVARPAQPHQQRPKTHQRQQPMYTRELTLFIQMQLCQTTLQDYLRYRNDQRGVAIRRDSIPSLSSASKTHNTHRGDRFGALSSLSKSDLSDCSGAGTTHAQSAPGSPMEGRSSNLRSSNNDLVDPAVNQTIFRAIVEGVAYIHDQDMIHRDLKPGNIFLSVPPGMDLERLLRESIGNSAGDETQQLAMWGAAAQQGGQLGYPDSSQSLTETLPLEKVQEVLFQYVEQLTPIIGDFGLVTDMDGSITGGGSAGNQTSPMDQLLQQNQDTAPSLSRRSSNMTSASSRARTTAIGTVTYASPEQLARPNMGYDQKADIYSLGIIYFELYHPFSTLMERHTVLRQLRNGELPPEFVSRWPKEAAFVLWLMADDPALRPTAREILEFDLIRKTPSPILPKTSNESEDPMDKAEQTTTTTTTTRGSEDSGAADNNRRSSTQEQGMASCAMASENKRLSVSQTQGLDLFSSSSSSSSLIRLLTAAEAIQVANSLPQTDFALYFSRQPICERCQTQCRCAEKSACSVPEQENLPKMKEKDEGNQPHGPLHTNNEQAPPPPPPQKPELKRRSSKRKSNSHRRKSSTHDASDPVAAAAATGSQAPTSAGMGGVSLEAKLKRMEQSLAAMRLENKALLDRIQQLEYEKSMGWKSDF